MCDRSVWEAVHPDERPRTHLPSNPNKTDPDWPFRGIDHVFVRCGGSGPTLLVRDCRRVFDRGADVPSDRYGLLADLTSPTP